MKLNYCSYGSFIKDDFFLKTFQNHNLQVYRIKSSHMQYAINIYYNQMIFGYHDNRMCVGEKAKFLQ